MPQAGSKWQGRGPPHGVAPRQRFGRFSKRPTVVPPIRWPVRPCGTPERGAQRRTSADLVDVTDEFDDGQRPVNQGHIGRPMPAVDATDDRNPQGRQGIEDRVMLGQLVGAGCIGAADEDRAGVADNAVEAHPVEAAAMQPVKKTHVLVTFLR